MMRALGQRVGDTTWDLVMGSAVGLLAGGASALFLTLLNRAIELRMRHLWLLGLLPVFGMASAWLYGRFGKEAEGGSRLILDEVVEYQGRVPSRMAPLVLIGTLLTHLGGGSAGREGTAIQMGASLARTLGKLPWKVLKLNEARQQRLLLAGVSGGFGSLFGTPFAGAIFGLEVLPSGRMRLESLAICACASLVGDGFCRWLGAQHLHANVAAMSLSLVVALKLMFFALPVALVAWLFVESSHGLARWSAAMFRSPYGRAALGGLAILALTALLRTTDYLNLGTIWLPRIFDATAPVPPWAFALKALFTVVTLGFGFKGGEVTPLFVIGALLGATLAPPLGLPAPFLAAVGFVALFAAASHTPIASTILGVELFGAGFVGPLLVVCLPAYLLMGHRSIYRSGVKEKEAP
ncbi:MAG: chloride channel protein [Firmicutes bacterium]|nr:chloride channel protein [Bacillota bacterium]